MFFSVDVLEECLKKSVPANLIPKKPQGNLEKEQQLHNNILWMKVFNEILKPVKQIEGQGDKLIFFP
jgi:hypothetical protein